MTKADLLKKVRAKCLSCCGGSHREVELCRITGCNLHDVRHGKDPTRRQLPPEQREILAQRLRQARLKKNRTPTVEKKSKKSRSEGQPKDQG
jgi:hypothetical protein